MLTCESGQQWSNRLLMPYFLHRAKSTTAPGKEPGAQTAKEPGAVGIFGFTFQKKISPAGSH